MTKGIVYILTNEAMPGYTKVGKTTSAIEDRMRSLFSTGVPLPFECYYAAEVDDMDRIEAGLHDAFGDHRVARREFFEIAPERVRAAQSLVPHNDVTPRGEVVDSKEDLEALNKARKRRSNFNFELVGIEPGAVLTHIRDDQRTCEVIDKRRINFEGEIMSLSSAALKVFHDQGYTWVGVSGPWSWKYGDDTLDELRVRLEEENDD